MELMEPLVQKFRQALGRMVSPGDRILAAVSGGPDSVVLLHLLREMQSGSLKFDLAIAHLNHLARGEDSARDAAFVVRLGNQWGLPAFVEEVDVAAEKELMKTSFQETGRILRYRFLERILQQWGGTRIALGHTADDQAETVLMNLLRGSGARGLTGMPARRDPLIRPLHQCFRREIEAYIEQHGLEFCSDSTNRERDYLRNRIRLELIPLLEQYNPQIKSTLIETSGLVKDDEDCLQERVDELYLEAAADPGTEGRSALDAGAVNRHHPALQKRLVRQAIFEARGDLRRIAARHVQEVLKLFHAPDSGKAIHLPGGLSAVVAGGKVVFGETPPRGTGILSRETTASPPMKIKVPGWTEMRAMGLKFHAELLSREDFFAPTPRPSQAYLDYDKTGPLIQVRFFRPGDRFMPLGMKGSKKLKSFFIDEKIPREQRHSVPLLTTQDDAIIWVYEKRIAESCRVTAETRTILFVEGVAAGNQKREIN